eukprot:NODE_1544_length_2442_cov_2.793089.p1 GENE.NODE_1544_length_2442_cov_2.793089~~NODE_1544_length_2442_cov_2.793089.p1  ORF type:complete len:362 (-),score=121.85 NODE_1544_length_2442_cov_2.793089:221-1306(-)
MRIAVDKGSFILGDECWWNLTDSTLILASLVELCADTGSNSSVWRIIRMFRLVRLLKLIKNTPLLTSLKSMIFGIIQCLVPLFWAVSLLWLISFTFGVYFMAGISVHLRNHDVPDMSVDTATVEDLTTLDFYYGTLYKSILTLTWGITGGADWSDLASPLKRIAESYYLVFLFYIYLICLGVLNIVTGYFVDGTLTATMNSREEIMREALARKAAVLEMLEQVFRILDVDASGTISFEELERSIDNDELQDYFKVLDLNSSDAKALFHSLDRDGSGEVTIGDFVSGCLRVTGTAKTIDLVSVLFLTQRILGVLESISAAIPGVAPLPPPSGAKLPVWGEDIMMLRPLPPMQPPVVPSAESG